MGVGPPLTDGDAEQRSAPPPAVATDISQSAAVLVARDPERPFGSIPGYAGVEEAEEEPLQDRGDGERGASWQRPQDVLRNSALPIPSSRPARPHPIPAAYGPP